MKEMISDERPREKLLLSGPASLGNSELLAILLRTGSGGKNVVETAHELLMRGGGTITGLSSMSVERMMDVPGIGLWKAATVSASIELARRFFSENPGSGKETVTGADSVFRIMIPQLKGLMSEEFWALYIGKGNLLISKEMLSFGGDSSTPVDVRKLVRRALEVHAAGVVVVHNHPSGDPRPGRADIKMTGAIRKSLESVDIMLVDHVVISDGSYFSFKDECVERAAPA